MTAPEESKDRQTPVPVGENPTPEGAVQRDAASDAGGLEDEDSQLLWQAAARGDALLADLEAGRPTESDLSGLLGYVREVVLARISDEDGTVLPMLQQASGDNPELEQIRQEHQLLRSDIDDLAAAAQHDTDAAELPSIVRQLITRLEHHLATEARILNDSGYDFTGRAWATAGNWYSLTEGPVVDMDLLKPQEAEAAILNRLTRMRPDEHLELHWTTNPQDLWLLLQRRNPGVYSWDATQSDGGAWSVTVCRRPV